MRISAGYFNSDPLPRPVGQIPLIQDPRNPAATIGGAQYPVDASGAPGTSFQNAGTSQPKFDARVDQEINGGRVTYQGGVAGSSGVIHTGIGPFEIQQGSYIGYGKVSYQRQALKVNAFANLTDVEAPNLLLADPTTQKPLQLNFSTETYDLEIGDSLAAGTKQVFTFGATCGVTISISPSRPGPRTARSSAPTCRTRSFSIGSGSRSVAAWTSSET